jgi:hypothetical protein
VGLDVFLELEKPTGVSVAGLDTVGRPGFASSSTDFPDPAELISGKPTTSTRAQSPRTSTALFARRSKEFIFETRAGRTSECTLPIPITARPTKSTRTVCIFTLYLVNRNFPGKTLPLLHSRHLGTAAREGGRRSPIHALRLLRPAKYLIYSSLTRTLAIRSVFVSERQKGIKSGPRRFCL